MRKAILAAVRLDDMLYFEETIEECKQLCTAGGIEIVAEIFQSANSMDPRTAFRKGKLDELKMLIEETGVDLVVFYNNLPLSITVTLESAIDADIMDRTNLILDIFESRASSKEAKLQTEMARLRYQLPAKLKEYVDEDRGRGGSVNNRGSGETRASVMKKNIGRRLSFLRRELENLRKTGDEKAVLRNRSSLKKVALVGYTNAGKSSLMNLLLRMNDRDDKQVLAKDQLFATLDTSIRRVNVRDHDFLLFDTVGFVSDLPHDLVEAFNSTLSAAKDADLLIHVMDASNPYFELQKETTVQTLRQIGASHIEMLDVYNKCDLIDTDESKGGLFISCKTKEGIDDLLDEIIHRLYPDEITYRVEIPYSRLGIISSYASSLIFQRIEDKDTGSMYLVSGNRDRIDSLIRDLKPFD